LGIISIVVSACSSTSSEPTATVAPSATSVAQDSSFYLNSIENNAVQITAAIARIEEQLSRVWPVRSSLFDAFSDSELSQEIISSIGAIVQLSPPDEFEQEHQLLRNTANTVVEYASGVEQSLERRDLVGMVVGMANVQVSYQRLLTTVSSQLCNALGVADDSELLCEVRAGAPGTYDADVEQLFKEFRVEFSPRVGAFPPALTDEERFDTVAALNEEVEVAAEEAAKKLASLSPPQGRADDHATMLTYLDEIGKTATAITKAGADRDASKLQQLFVQSGTVTESAASSISCEYQDSLLHGWFAAACES